VSFGVAIESLAGKDIACDLFPVIALPLERNEGEASTLFCSVTDSTADFQTCPPRGVVKPGKVLANIEVVVATIPATDVGTFPVFSDEDHHLSRISSVRRLQCWPVCRCHLSARFLGVTIKIGVVEDLATCNSSIVAPILEQNEGEATTVR